MKTFLLCLLAPLFCLSALQAEEPSLRLRELPEFIKDQHTNEWLAPPLGKNLSPALAWTHPPLNTKSFTLIMESSDGTTCYWALARLPCGINELKEGISKSNFLINGGMQGANSTGSIGYQGPKAAEDKVQHINLTLYALDIFPTLHIGFSCKEIKEIMEGHILASATLEFIVDGSGRMNLEPLPFQEVYDEVSSTEHL